jgi:hypothetical protein
LHAGAYFVREQEVRVGQVERTPPSPIEKLQDSIFSAYQVALELGDTTTAEALLRILGHAGRDLPPAAPNVQRLVPPRAAA